MECNKRSMLELNRMNRCLSSWKSSISNKPILLMSFWGKFRRSSIDRRARLLVSWRVRNSRILIN